MKKSLFFLFFFLIITTSLQAQSWGKLGIGTNGLNAIGNGGPYNMCADRSGNIYVAGWFWDMNLDSSYQYVNVYKWNGTIWSELGTGTTALNSSATISGAQTGGLCVDSSGNVYVEGAYDSLGILYPYIAKWDGTSWTKLGGLFAFATYDIGPVCLDKSGNVYIGCGYADTTTTTAYSDTNQHSHIEKWDGTSWSQVDTGTSELNANNTINTIFVDTLGNIYVAGTFTDGINDTSGNIYVAKWNGTSWSELGTGVAPQYHGLTQIFSLLEDTGGNIYASGTFTNSSNKYYVAKWDGTSWSELGTGMNALNANGFINTMCWDIYGNLYAGGDFTDTTITMTVYPDGDSGTGHPFYVAKWDGTTWSKLGSGTNSLNANDWIMAVCSDLSGNIYATGNFTDTTIAMIVDSNYYHPYYVAEYTNPALGTVPIHKITSVNVYPNPALSTVNVSIKPSGSTAINSDYLLYDCTGRICHSGKLNSAITSIDISTLPAGVYILTLGNLSTGAYRVVKE